MNLRLSSLPMALVLLFGCAPKLPALQQDGKYVRWGAVDGSSVACQGLSDRADAYIEALHALIGEDLPDGVIAHYYYDPEMQLVDDCDEYEACALVPSHRENRNGKVVEIYARHPLNYHELAHAVHQMLVGQPESTLLGEAFATYFENDDPELAALGPAQLPIPLGTLVDEDHPSLADALTLGAAIGQTHGPETFWEFFVASQHARTLDELDAQLASVAGVTLTQTVENFLGTPVCEAVPLACSDAPRVPEGDIYEIEIPVACDAAQGAVGPLSDELPLYEYRWVLDLAEVSTMAVRKPDGVDLRYYACAQWCESGSGGVGLAQGRTEGEYTFASGRWEILASFNLDEVGDGRVSFERLPAP